MRVDWPAQTLLDQTRNRQRHRFERKTLKQRAIGSGTLSKLTGCFAFDFLLSDLVDVNSCKKAKQMLRSISAYAIIGMTATIMAVDEKRLRQARKHRLIRTRVMLRETGELPLFSF
jgi:hypothetical protein